MNDADIKRRDKQDMQRLISMILSSPIKRDVEVKRVDGEIALEQFKGANVDIKTRILLQVAQDAIHGGSNGLKSAEFLFKYGGYEPPKEQDISLMVPTFIDDMPTTAEETVGVTAALPEGDDADKLDDPEFVKKALEEAKDKPDVVTDDEDIPISDVSNE